MARTADLKRKRTTDDDADDTPNKVIRIDNSIHGQAILHILETEDTEGLLDRHTPSLRSLLSKSTPISLLRTAIASLPQQQQDFCNLAISLLDQASQGSSSQSSLSNYALVQHLPSGDWWSSLTSLNSPSKLQTAKAELVVVLPSPSSIENSVATLGSYSSRTITQKKFHHSHRVVSTGAFLNYGLFSSFAPSFDQDGELVGRRELGQVLYYQEEKECTRHVITGESLQDTDSIPEAPRDPPDPSHNDDFNSELDLETLLPPDEVKALKATLNSLELENSVQKLLERNQRALERLKELQSQRLTNHPISNAEEGSEEWDTAQAVLDSLTTLTSLRPRSSSEDSQALIPPPSVLHKLHRTLAVGPSPGWYGILPSGNMTALRDDSTVKVRSGVVVPTPVPAAAAPTTTSVTNTFGSYPYAYTQQQQTYRPQAASYTPYKAGQTPSFYQGYVAPGTQQQQTYYNAQTYATGTANQQPYGATAAQQPYAGYSSWYSYPVQGSAGSGRGTPQPIVGTPTSVPSSYGGFFNASGSRPAAVANTVVGNAVVRAVNGLSR